LSEPRSRSEAIDPAPAVRAMSGTIRMTRLISPAAVRPNPANPDMPVPASESDESPSDRITKAIVYRMNHLLRRDSRISLRASVRMDRKSIHRSPRVTGAC